MINLVVSWILYLISLPARLKGMTLGKGSYLGPGYDWLFVRLHGVILGDHVYVGRDAWIQTADNGKITIGNHTSIGRRCTISARRNIQIGDDCMLSYNVSILDHDHLILDPDVLPSAGKLTEGKKITIENGCFIGANVCVLKGVHLGKRCVVGANAVVTRSFPPFTIIAGNPARAIGTIS